MSLFPSVLFYDSTVQVDDKTRFSGEKSFVSKDEDPIIDVEINPDVGTASYISVMDDATENWHLDWQYGASGTYTVDVRITTADGTTGSASGSISVVSSADDKLFSTDQDLLAEEPDILKYLPEWRSSYKYLHRRAQERMFAWIDEKGWIDVFNNKFTKADVTDTEELNEWSKYMVLRMLFESMSNVPDDIFANKRDYYNSKELMARSRLVLRLDIDADGTVDTFEDLFMNSGRAWRR